ncbi:hypothetical protein Acor_17460 [Acrocarpospora corrugata]|uniref:Aminotransferase class I/classII domain-containing protein n=1 Tax=Acrocarpospora corrugata TaxID=35763 RepID=A0A5M3VX78_9ACTN|nr:hypothetical protein [Acrocarpospora corrugata]GER99682.1 hypothetical protein Acor_17460 [Acrocarpospora corrugata]
MKELVRRIADRMVDKVVPHVEAQACGWEGYCKCTGGAIYLYYCDRAGGREAGGRVQAAEKQAVGKQAAGVQAAGVQVAGKRVAGKRVVIGLEDPAPPRMRAVLAAHGIVVPLAVHEEGARPEPIPGDCDIVVLMPERNDPLGVRMSSERRQRIADWAAQRGRLVVEPAADGVFNVGGSPLPSLMAIGDAGSTVMIGTFTEVLTPAAQLAYLVVPRRLAEVLADRVSSGREQPSAVCQRAIAELLSSGSVARRLARLPSLYQPKRLLVRAALGGFAEVGLVGTDSGSSATLLLPADVRAAEIVRSLRHAELIATDLTAYCHPNGHHRNGVVLGYGHLDDMTLRRATRLITHTLNDHGLARRNLRYRRTVA